MDLLGGVPYVRRHLHPPTIQLPQGFLIIQGVVVGGVTVLTGIIAVILAGLDMEVCGPAHQKKGFVLGCQLIGSGGGIVDDAVNLVVILLHAQFGGFQAVFQQTTQPIVSQQVHGPAR